MEYFLLIIEFYYIKGKSILWSIIPPGIVGFFIFNFSNHEFYINHFTDLQNNIMTVLGILIGFSISVFTILLTVNNLNIEKSKVELINKKIFSKDISLYDTVLIGLGYLIIVQGLLLIGNFIYPLFVDVKEPLSLLFFSINLGIVIHVILLLLRIILDFYFIITKK